MPRCPRPLPASLELVIVLLIFIVVNLASQYLQTPVSYQDGKGWDGVEYYNIAQAFRDGQLPNAAAPFVYRVGTPFLVSLFFKGDLLFGFKVLNIVANLLTVCLLLFWLRLYISNWTIRIFSMILFMIQWHGPIRFVYYYSAITDPWAFVWLLAGLIGIHRFSSYPSLKIAFSVGFVAFVGTFFREFILLVPIAFLFATNPIELNTNNIPTIARTPPMAAFIPIIFGIASLQITHLIASSQSNSYFFKAALNFAYEKPMLAYLHALFITYGPIIIVPALNWRRVAGFLLRHQFMLIYLMGILVLAWIGGSDTERILNWASPIVYVLIGRSMADCANLLRGLPLAIIILFQSISQRLFWTIPDYPNDYITSLPFLTIMSGKLQYLDLYSFHGRRLIEAISLLEYLLLSVLLLWWLKSRERNTNTK